MTSWIEHPLCGPHDTMPTAFWGPERLDSAAFVDLVSLLSPDVEIAAILVALKDIKQVVDVGGGTGLITQAIAKGAEVTLIDPDPAQRALVPGGIVVADGRAEAVPLPDQATEAAIATWVLQYCDDPRKAIDELARIARHRVVIVQAAPGNDLVELYNREAAVAGLPAAHHGWLLAEAATRLEAAGFTVTLQRLAIPVRAPAGGAEELANTLARLHFAGHPKLADMIAVTTPLIGRTLAIGSGLSDDGVLLSARR
ncbi:MAG: class I SAM-dependent methyltransferase [Deltaproteobacteria bacterium]|nr:class I SAM-dependent methyltransferase [Deltaproteobacteria bacterium]